MRTIAPYASPHLLGLGDTAPPGTPYPDQDFTLVCDITLTASQTGLIFTKQIQRDADFVWRGVVANSQTGIYSVSFNINGWYLLSDGPILNANLQSDPSSPFVTWPDIVVPAGGVINLIVNDLSAAPNTIEILLRGVRRAVLGGGR